MTIKQPKRRYSISVEVEANTEEELWEAFKKCSSTVKSKFACASLGGVFEDTRYDANYEEFPNKTADEWMKEREAFAKFHFDKITWEHNWEPKLELNEKQA